jgi:ABC-type transporter MlaC component
MSNTNTGGPAFPFEYFDEQLQRARVMHGMTLRDYFAAKAMQSLILTKHYQDIATDQPAMFVEMLTTLADESYDYADAMLEARRK